MDQKSKKKEICTSHYVGYVEDHETVDQIMKKFELLDQFKKEKKERSINEIEDENIGKFPNDVSSKSCENHLSTEDLNTIFKLTSNFTQDSLTKREHINIEQNQRQIHNTLNLKRREKSNLDQIPDSSLSNNSDLKKRELMINNNKFDNGEIIKKWIVEESSDCNNLSDEYIDDEETNYQNHYNSQKKMFDHYETEVKDFDQEDILFEDESDCENIDDMIMEYSDEEQTKLEDNEYFDKKSHKQLENMKLSNKRKFLNDSSQKVNKKHLMNGFNVKKRDRSSQNSLTPTFIKIPQPLPFAQAAPIFPLETKSQHNVPPYSRYIEANNIFNVDLFNFSGGSIQGILMNPPWQLPFCSKDSHRIIPKDLKCLNISRKLAPNTVIFIWVEKEYTHDVVRLMENCQNFRYVETMVQVRKHVNNKFVCEDSPVFSRSKATLLMFRRKYDPSFHSADLLSKDYLSGKEPPESRLELGHQRTCDVVFDFVRIDEETGEEIKPEEYTYKMIETLLPTSMYTENYTHPMLLELPVKINVEKDRLQFSRRIRCLMKRDKILINN